jgi:hypothetical protein
MVQRFPRAVIAEDKVWQELSSTYAAVGGLSKAARFSEVILDFNNVEEVGQGFADEIFRVWPATHTRTTIKPVNMVRPVAFMIERARRHRRFVVR